MVWSYFSAGYVGMNTKQEALVPFWIKRREGRLSVVLTRTMLLMAHGGVFSGERILSSRLTLLLCTSSE